MRLRWTIHYTFAWCRVTGTWVWPRRLLLVDHVVDAVVEMLETRLTSSRSTA
ncbi:hypothetical protein [Mycobacterium sp. 1164966.3]|uniref:hypothetical protein n=1 Tax=Mycobacterium sp. 1164966.3 TaxID=1856861 RepID=UPI0012E9225E